MQEVEELVFKHHKILLLLVLQVELVEEEVVM